MVFGSVFDMFACVVQIAEASACQLSSSHSCFLALPGVQSLQGTNQHDCRSSQGTRSTLSLLQSIKADFEIHNRLESSGPSRTSTNPYADCRKCTYRIHVYIMLVALLVKGLHRLITLGRAFCSLRPQAMRGPKSRLCNGYQIHPWPRQY